MQLIENTVEGWGGVIAELTVKKQTAENQSARLSSERKSVALEAALGGGGADAQKRLTRINAALSDTAILVDDINMAIAHAEEAKLKASQHEAEAAERQRREQIAANLDQYVELVRQIDADLRSLVSKFAAAKQSLNRAEVLLKTGESQSLRQLQLQSAFGGTLAAAHAGLGEFIELGSAAQHTAHRQPLGQFAGPFVERWLAPGNGKE